MKRLALSVFALLFIFLTPQGHSQSLQDIQTSNSLARTAKRLLAEQRFDEAISKYKEAMFYSPDYRIGVAHAYQEKAYFLMRQKKYGEAIFPMRSTIKYGHGLDDDFTKGSKFGALATLLGAVDRLSEAIQAAKYSIRFDPDDAGNYFTLGDIYERQEKYNEAIFAFNEAKKRDHSGEFTGLINISIKRLKRNHLKKSKKKIPPSANRQSSGSAFILPSNRHFITNAHVINGCKVIKVGNGPKQDITVEIVSKDDINDLALLKIINSGRGKESGSMTQPTGIAVEARPKPGSLRSNDIALGERVMVAGYPYGSYISNSMKVTFGIVSSTIGIGNNSGQFQLDAAVQPGNSGGPIFDKGGNIVGVVVSRIDKMKMVKATGSLPENSNFGIKASTIKTFLSANGMTVRPTVTKRELSTERIAEIAKRRTVMVVCLR